MTLYCFVKGYVSMEAIDKLRELSKKLEDPYFIKEFEEEFEKFLKEKTNDNL